MSDIYRRRHRSNRVCSFILFYLSNITHANFLRWILYKIIKLNALDLTIESGEDQCIKFVRNVKWISGGSLKNVSLMTLTTIKTPRVHGRHVEPAEQRRGGHHEQLLTTTNQMPPRTPRSQCSRCFHYINQNSSWLAHSSHLKCALCKYCVL